MHKLFGINILTSICSVSISLGFTLFCSRFYSIEEFGDLRYVMTLIPLVVIASLPGFDSVVLKAGFDKSRIKLVDIVKVKFTSSAFICAVIYCLIEYGYGGDKQYFIVLQYVLLLIPLYELFSSYKNYLIGRGFSRQAASAYFTSKIASVLLFYILLLVVFLFDLEYIYVIPSFLISLIVPQTVIYFRILRLKIFLLDWKSVPSRTLLLSGASSTVAGAFTTLAFSIDKLMVFQFMGAQYLALYSILIMVPQEIAKLIDSFIPYIYKSLEKYKIDKLDKRVVFIFLSICMFIPVYIFTFSNLSGFVFGKEFVYGYVDISLSTILIMTQSVEFYFTQKIYLNRGAKLFIYHSLVNNVITFSLMYLLGGLFGISGYLSALVIKNVLLSLMTKLILDKK
ncbi:hypothetical protein HWV01_03255 [Moritella sp. 5]|uniref:hypothetical protein n=1 Tax=Moritella sp. 5 TaxID=2746231 RepID=UPI001BA48F97|nr:hypothetical protein [Moritella sp. 5]QUM79391.1 hypothetical protein HWV01_03255 [Moritella sp. 5]